MSFSVGAFALAGAAMAAGPIIIHLLHRRRFRTIDWAAMQFLRQAVRQSRRIMQLRDLLLMLLRTAAVLLFGLAMARPYFSSGVGSFGVGEPIHAVLLVDNSLSTAFRDTTGTVLQRSLEQCKRFVEALPPGSRTAIVPICSDPTDYSLDPTANKQAALEALDAIRPVDRRAGVDAALELGKQALRRLPDMPNKRVVLLGDGQKINFPADGIGPRAAELGDVQLVVLRPEPLENAWVADLRATDGVAVGGAAAEFTAIVRYEGPARRPGVQVGITVDGVLIESRTVDLEPGARRLVTFLHRFAKPDATSAARFADVSVALSADRLPEDDMRHTVVPIVEPLPIVYVTTHGPNNEATESTGGRGLWIQRLLAPVVERGDVEPKLVQIQHVALGALDSSLIQNARLIVLAGLASPGDRAALLREYVEQGGQLLITAGEDFDPGSWTELAWRDGAGILPCPLKPTMLSVRETDPPKPLRFDATTLGHRYFRLEEATDEELSDLYSAPAFFAVAQSELDEATIGKVVATETARIVKQREERAAAARITATPTTATTTTNTTSTLPITPPVEKLRLPWIEPPADRDHERTPEELAKRSAPQVIGRFVGGLPFLVERKIDRGTVMFCSTGMQSSWSTLALSRAIVVLDRMSRDLIERTLPRTNFDTTEPVLVPTRVGGSGTYFQLVRPGDRREPLVVDALGDDKYALVLRNLADRGTYKIVAQQAELGGGDSNSSNTVAEKTLWTLPLAVNGPESESHLAGIEKDAALGEKEIADVRWVSTGEEINVAGASVRGQNLWKWLMLAALLCLLAELAILKFMRPAPLTVAAPSGLTASSPFTGATA
jgi:hypothetical protein